MTEQTTTPGVFLAYDKVQFAQYEDYQIYATLNSGKESFQIAEKIRGNAYGDEVVHNLNKALDVVRYESPMIDEYTLFVIRSANGETFDVYLNDEDRLFIDCAANVAYDDVLNVAAHLAATSGVNYSF